VSSKTQRQIIPNLHRRPASGMAGEIRRCGVSAQVLLVECADQRGLVHTVTGVLLKHGVNVVGNQEFVERPSARFFMRTEFDGAVDAGQLETEVRSALPPNASVRLSHLKPKRIVVLASKEHHCLGDILIRHTFGEINAQVLAVISNHAVLQPLAGKFDLPFHHISHESLTREAHEAEMFRVIEPLQPDYLVLAKYMRVLTPEFVRRFPARIVNIHHSFLPAFAGARPYQQAFDRGVKVIGATAHFVTEKLDEGPIVVQQVIPVDHTHTAHDLSQAGRDVEQMVLARALRLVFEDRVFLCGNRTVIFD
jgi:formyltetrahydrofolate deformylase